MIDSLLFTALKPLILLGFPKSYNFSSTIKKDADIDMMSAFFIYQNTRGGFAAVERFILSPRAYLQVSSAWGWPHRLPVFKSITESRSTSQPPTDVRRGPSMPSRMRVCSRRTVSWAMRC